MIKNVILDTDLGSDVDDVGAVALANIFNNQKKINLLCVTHTTSGEYGPLICEAINEFYGNKNIEVGVYKGPTFMKEELPNSYPEVTANAFSHKHKNVSELPDAVEILRKNLSSHEHVTLIFIGQLLNLYNLMKSGPDKYSNLDGLSLINEKVDAVYIMGGKFPEVTGIPSDDQPEYNLLTALEASIYTIRRLKVKTVFVDGTIGSQVTTGAKVIREHGDKHIVGFAYSHYIYREKDGSRFSWDPITVYKGCIDDSLLNEVGPGMVTIDDQGNTKFVDDKNGNFYVVTRNASYEEIKEKLDNLLSEGK